MPDEVGMPERDGRLVTSQDHHGDVTVTCQKHESDPPGISPKQKSNLY
jgi:hypothetical protein